jgi:hypothetical protein
LSYLNILNCAIKLTGDSTLESVQYLILYLVASNLKVLILQLPSQFCAGFGSLGLMTSVLVTIIIPKPKKWLNHHEDYLVVVGFERLFSINSATFDDALCAASEHVLSNQESLSP